VSGCVGGQVLARDIPGNRALKDAAGAALHATCGSKDGQCGVRLFNSPEECIAQANALFQNSGAGTEAATLGADGARASAVMATREYCGWRDAIGSVLPEDAAA
jgi:hypothetical protein